MKKQILLVALLLAAAVTAVPAARVFSQEATPASSPLPAEVVSPPPLPSPKPAPDDPKIHKLAVQQFLAWQQGTVDRNLYSDDVNSQLNDQTLNDAEKTLANMGGLQQVAFRGISSAKKVNVYVYHMTCEHGAVDMDFALQPDGKIALIFFV